MTFFRNAQGKGSMMRLLCFIVTVATLPALYIHPDNTTELCLLISACLAGKWLQKEQA